MEIVLDKLESSTGWTASDATKIEIFGVNQIPQFIANDNAGSLIIHLKPNSKGAYVTKTLTSTDISSAKELCIWTYSSRSQYSGENFNNGSDFLLYMDLNATMTPIYLPVYSELSPVIMSSYGITSATRIRFTSNTNVEQYIVVSNLTAVNDELPLDLYKGLKRYLVANRDVVLSSIQVGTVTCSKDDTEIEISGTRQYIDKYAVVKIGSEYHQLGENSDYYYKFLSTYSGSKMLSNFTNEPVYLYLDVRYDLSQNDVLIPGIAISGMTQRPLLRGGKIETIHDTFRTDGNHETRLDDLITEWSIDVIAQSRHLGILAKLNDVIRTTIAREYIWVNGKKLYIFFDAEPTYIDNTDENVMLYGMAYSVKIEVKEQIWQRSTTVPTQTQTVSIEPSLN